jgi:predicted NBD/HSP70 family sugar kinase
MALNPDGAYSIGIKIGRRSLDVLLLDFAAQVRERLTLDYDFPDPDTLFDEIRVRLKLLRKSLGPKRAALLRGVGIAAPLSLGGWQQLLGVAPEQAARLDGDRHRGRGAGHDTAARRPVQGHGGRLRGRAGGRARTQRAQLSLRVRRHLHRRRAGARQPFAQRPHGNAGAIGSMSLGLGAARSEPPRQLLSVASLFTLEKMYGQAGLDTGAVADDRAMRAPWLPVTQAWLAQCAPGIALAAHNAAALLDLESVIIDGSFSRELLAATLAKVDAALDRYDWEGLTRPSLMAGAIGADARAVGGALLPLHGSFAPDRDLFLKDDA